MGETAIVGTLWVYKNVYIHLIIPAPQRVLSKHLQKGLVAHPFNEALVIVGERFWSSQKGHLVDYINPKKVLNHPTAFFFRCELTIFATICFNFHLSMGADGRNEASLFFQRNPMATQVQFD